MPDPTQLEQLLLQRPTATPNPVTLPPGDPNAVEEQVYRALGAFMQGPFTERTPGANNQIPELIGGAAGILPIGRMLGMLKGIGTGVKEAQALRAVPTIAKGAENELSPLAAQLDSRISGLPPAPGSGRPIHKAPTSGYEDVIAAQAAKAPPHYPVYPQQPNTLTLKQLLDLQNGR